MPSNMIADKTLITAFIGIINSTTLVCFLS